jgi:hypothetical protein
MKITNMILDEFFDNQKTEFLSSEKDKEIIKGKGKDTYNRSIENIKPGLIFLLQFNSLIEENNNKIDFITENILGLPAVILKKYNLEDDWPVYDIGFWSLTKNGEKSGMLVIKEICVWRYFKGTKVNKEGIPPQWFIDQLLDNEGDDILFPESNLDIYDIFYIKDNKEIYLKNS